MLDILVWLWHDPTLQGSRGSRNRGVIQVPTLRSDLIPSGRRLRKMVAAGKPPSEQPAPQLPADAPSLPRNFKPAHVNRLAELFATYLPIPHRFVCIADHLEGFSQRITVIKTPPEALAADRTRSPEGNRFPSCYRRLWAQSKDAAKVLGPRVLAGDIDMIPVRDLSPIVKRDEPFVGWRPFRDWGTKMRIGGGLQLFTPGSHPEVWDDFTKNPSAAVAQARAAGFRGSDQAWLSYKLAGKVPVWGRDSGLYSIRDLGADHALPADARLVQLNGPDKPWSYRGRATWVAQFWNGR